MSKKLHIERGGSPLVFEDIRVDYIDHMGSDLRVVNAARTTHNKESEWESFDGRSVEDNGVTVDCSQLKLKEKDVRLIRYLDDHGHWTPFSHTAITVRVKAPIFVARQLIRHTVGLTWNEVSRRYVDDDITFYMPESWRKRVPNIKQGSSQTESVDAKDFVLGVSIDDEKAELTFEDTIQVVLSMYNKMIETGVAPEVARAILPHNLMTQWYWTGNLASWARVCNLRLDPHSQYETRVVAKKISDIIQGLFPVSWNKLVLEKNPCSKQNES